MSLKFLVFDIPHPPPPPRKFPIPSVGGVWIFSGTYTILKKDVKKLYNIDFTDKKLHHFTTYEYKVCLQLIVFKLQFLETK